jgi:hypothetical protein
MPCLTLHIFKFPFGLERTLASWPPAAPVSLSHCLYISCLSISTFSLYLCCLLLPHSFSPSSLFLPPSFLSSLHTGLLPIPVLSLLLFSLPLCLLQRSPPSTSTLHLLHSLFLPFLPLSSNLPPPPSLIFTFSSLRPSVLL